MRPLVLLCFAVVPGAAWGHCNTSIVCDPSDDPCVVAAVHDIDGGCVLDFGDRTLVVPAGARLDAGDGAMYLRARDLLNEAGGAIVAEEGSIDITLTGDLWSDGQLAASAYYYFGNLTVDAGGRIDIVGGSVSTVGIEDAWSGSMTIVAGGPIDVSGDLDLSAGLDSRGGDLTIRGASVSLLGDINTNGGYAGGGDIQIDAPGDCVFGDGTFLQTAADSATGGTFEANCGGDLVSDARIKGGAGETGDAGDITFTARGVEVRGTLDTRGHDVASQGGVVTVTASEWLSVPGDILAGSEPDYEGYTGPGGAVVLHSDGPVEISGLVDVTTASFAAGHIGITGHDATIAGAGLFAGAEDLADGGTITIDVAGTLAIAAPIDASATTAGRVDLTGCAVLVNDDVSAEGGEVTVTATSDLVVTSSVTADRITLVHGGLPPDIDGATFSVDPEMVFDPSLDGCEPLVLWGPDGGVAGRKTWFVSGASAAVALWVGRPGPGPEVPGCPGVHLAFLPTMRIGRATPRPDGVVRFSARVPEGRYLFQAAEPASCRVTTPIVARFR